MSLDIRVEIDRVADGLVTEIEEHRSALQVIGVVKPGPAEQDLRKKPLVYLEMRLQGLKELAANHGAAISTQNSKRSPP